MSDELKVAIEAAKVGAEIALRYFDQDISVEFKEDKTPVTIADLESEKAIIKAITKKFPNSNFVAEETGGDRDLDEFWTIDPIDGTRSFTRGIPGWCVLISLFRDNDFILGVSYFPFHDEMLYAEKGKGAFYNGKKVRVSKIDSFNKAYFGFGNIKYIENRDSLINLVDASASSRSWEVTYANFLLAQGKVDTVLDAYGLIWDTAPFKVIIEEAGGKITRPDGSEIKPNNKRGYLSTNGLLHDEVLKILNKK